VHLTGTYSFPTLPVLACARALGKPLIWSPRGALQATADWQGAPRRKAKHLFEKIAHFVRGSHVTLHLTSADEALHSAARLGGIQTALIPNCVQVPPLEPRPQRAPTRLLFLGRLHPKKGLDLLLDAMMRLPDAVTLDIYGSGDPDYVAHIRARCGSRIRLHGHADEAIKAQAFANADLFVLPSFSENFGIAVAEALAHGIPVLTTTRSPWQRVESKGCGACIHLENSDLAAEILRLLDQDLPAMGARGRAWMLQEFSTQTMVQQFVQLYRDCADGPAQKVIA
jgi:glycosyltransferase involved in cell wall biosynthesis